MLDWNDIRFFLAAGRAGSLNAAAKLLRVSQPTVGRRIDALEADLKVVLFDRHQDGLVLTESGHQLWLRALAVEEATLAMERQAAAHDDLIGGEVKVSVTEGLGAFWLIPRLSEFQKLNPTLLVEVLLDNDPADLLRRQADVALRLARPLKPTLIGRRIGQMTFDLFASRDYIEQYGEPCSPGDLLKHRFVSLSLRRSVADESWHDLIDAGAAVSFKSNSPIAQLQAVRAGLGIGLLPSYIAQDYPDLVPLLGTGLWKPREVWLVAHPDLRNNPRIRLVFDAIAEMWRHDQRFSASSNFNKPIELQIEPASR